MMCGWQSSLCWLGFIAALVLLVTSCRRVKPKRNNAVRLNPMFSRDWKNHE